MKTIGITGGTGFVGKHLTGLLIQKGYKVIIFTTRVATKPAQDHISYAHWNPMKGAFDINALKEVDAVVHLAGTGIADKRWTEKRKKEIVDSRVVGTSFLVAQLKNFGTKCKTLIAASATGYYGKDGDKIPFHEDALPANDFLGNTCLKWEQCSSAANTFLRTVILRLGIVLGKDAGAFHEFARPMSFGIMPILGKGTQVVSWIEVDDLARLILFALEHEEIAGVYNAVAPAPVPHRQLMQTIAKTKGGIKIPIPVPEFALRTLYGELSGEVLKSCTVSAEKTMSTGFQYNYPDIGRATSAILGKPLK